MKRLIAFLGVVFALSAIVAAERPNIVYVLADDLGWTDVACYGSRYYETPNIDRLAAQGMKFTRYHNCQNCQPTRAALMSGRCRQPYKRRFAEHIGRSSALPASV